MKGLGLGFSLGVWGSFSQTHAAIEVFELSKVIEYIPHYEVQIRP